MGLDLLFPLPGNEALTSKLASSLKGKVGSLTARHFPDGETYLRFETPLEKKNIALVCSLNDPDTKLVRLIFAADAAKQLGAAKIGLVAPYLAYMRQDIRFNPGEAVTSRSVAGMLSTHFDWLVTVDPHLHRYRSLSELYSIPTRVVHAAPEISAWIRANIQKPFLAGPDQESSQWVADIAADLGVPYVTIAKHRLSDRHVTLEPFDIEIIGQRTPVIVDDIIASGETMIGAINLLQTAGHKPAVCIAVHGLFANDADKRIASLGTRILTTNTVVGPMSSIDISQQIADGVRAIIAAG